MAFVVTRDELIDWFMEFKQAECPDDPITREQAESLVQDVTDNGKIVFASKGTTNFVGETLLIKVAISVIAGLIGKAIIWGAGKAWEEMKLPPPHIADKLGYKAEDERRPVVINVIQFIQTHKMDVIVERLETSAREEGSADGNAKKS